MAWNRSIEDDSRAWKPSAPRRAGTARSTIWGVAGVLVVLVAAVGVWWLRPNGESAGETPTPQTKQRIKEVASVPARTNAVAGPQRPKKLSREEHLAQLQAKFDAEAMAKDPTFAERRRKFDEWKRSRPFKHTSEIEIAAVLSIRPGDYVLMSDFQGDLEEDFLKHLNDPIVINEDDSDEVKELKKQMIEIKPQLKRQMDKGERLADILNDYRKEMMKVHELKYNLEQELEQIRKKATSVQEVEDFVAAANKMLEEYGTEEVHVPLPPSALRLIERNAASAAQEGVKE